MQFPNDVMLLRAATATIVALRTIHAALMIKILYIYTISSAANPLLVMKITWNTGAICVIEGYYLRRVWIRVVFICYTLPMLTSSAVNNGRRGLALVIILFSLLAARCGFEFATAIYSWLPSTSSWTSFHDTREPFLSYSGWLAFAAVGDVAIAAVLCFFLWNRRSDIRTYLQSRCLRGPAMFLLACRNSRNSVIRRTVAFTINNGALTAAVAVAGLIIFLVMRDSP